MKGSLLQRVWRLLNNGATLKTAFVFYRLHCNSLDTSGVPRAARRVQVLPHTCSSDSAEARLTSPLRQIEQDELFLVWTREELQGGWESGFSWYLFDLVLAQDAAEPGQGLVYFPAWKP